MYLLFELRLQQFSLVTQAWNKQKQQDTLIVTYKYVTNRAISDLLKCHFFHSAFRTSHSGLPPLFFSLTEVLRLAQF